jgi:LacI family transcriptional regulator
VCHDLEGMAYQAAALLDRLMAGRKPPNEVIRVPPTGLVTRRSTDIVAVDNLQVARALRFMQDQYTNPWLGVDAVVAATGLTRRALEKVFRQEMKRTLNEEIVRLRMESVKSLLTTTSLKVVEVAAASGFARPSHLFRTFRKQLGLSPKTYRKRKAAKTGPSASPRARR